jgi:hypothetical protein
VEHIIEIDELRDFRDYELTDDPMVEGEWVFVDWTWDISAYTIDQAFSGLRAPRPRGWLGELLDHQAQRQQTMVPFVGLRLSVLQNGSPVISSRVAFNGENSDLSNNLVELGYERSRGVAPGDDTIFRLWPRVAILVHSSRNFVTKGALHASYKSEWPCGNHRLLEYSLEMVED